MMSGIEGLGRMMRPSSTSPSPFSAQQPVEVAAVVVDHAAPVSPYPAIVDPFKRRGALREYFRGLRGENKENEGVDMDGDGNGKLSLSSSSSPGLPKQKTLGLCRRHVVPSAVAGAGAGGQRDKRKFNAPRQTPEKRQKPDESEGSPGADVPRRLDVGNEMSGSEDVSYSVVQLAASREHVELETSMMGQGTGSREEDGLIRRSEMVLTGAKEVSASINRQVHDSPSFSFKREAQEPPKTPTMRKPLMPLHSNRQAIHVHASPVSHLPMQPNFSGGMERECSSGSSESLFQLASGKKYQPSAAAKARAALMFESDAEPADLPDFE